MKFIKKGWEGMNDIWNHIFKSREYVTSLLSGVVVAFIGIFFQFMYFLWKKDYIGIIWYGFGFILLLLLIFWTSYLYSKLSDAEDEINSAKRE